MPSTDTPLVWTNEGNHYRAQLDSDFHVKIFKPERGLLGRPVWRAVLYQEDRRAAVTIADRQECSTLRQAKEQAGWWR